MRSPKHVKKSRRIRSIRNAASCKRKAYMKRLELKRIWQTNSIFTGYRVPNIVVPPPKIRTIKERKQLTPEEYAQRQRYREQKRLEKELARQKASTSEIKNIKKAKEKKHFGRRNVAAQNQQPKQKEILGTKGKAGLSKEKVKPILIHNVNTAAEKPKFSATNAAAAVPEKQAESISVQPVEPIISESQKSKKKSSKSKSTKSEQQKHIICQEVQNDGDHWTDKSGKFVKNSEEIKEKYEIAMEDNIEAQKNEKLNLLNEAASNVDNNIELSPRYEEKGVIQKSLDAKNCLTSHNDDTCQTSGFEDEVDVVSSLPFANESRKREIVFNDNILSEEKVQDLGKQRVSEEHHPLPKEYLLNERSTSELFEGAHKVDHNVKLEVGSSDISAQQDGKMQPFGHDLLCSEGSENSKLAKNVLETSEDKLSKKTGTLCGLDGENSKVGDDAKDNLHIIREGCAMEVEISAENVRNEEPVNTEEERAFGSSLSGDAVYPGDIKNKTKKEKIGKSSKQKLKEVDFAPDPLISEDNLEPHNKTISSPNHFVLKEDELLQNEEFSIVTNTEQEMVKYDAIETGKLNSEILQHKGYSSGVAEGKTVNTTDLHQHCENIDKSFDTITVESNKEPVKESSPSIEDQGCTRTGSDMLPEPSDQRSFGQEPTDINEVPINNNEDEDLTLKTHVANSAMTYGMYSSCDYGVSNIEIVECQMQRQCSGSRGIEVYEKECEELPLVETALPSYEEAVKDRSLEAVVADSSKNEDNFLSFNEDGEVKPPSYEEVLMAVESGPEEVGNTTFKTEKSDNFGKDQIRHQSELEDCNSPLVVSAEVHLADLGYRKEPYEFDKPELKATVNAKNKEKTVIQRDVDGDGNKSTDDLQKRTCELFNVSVTPVRDHSHVLPTYDSKSAPRAEEEKTYAIRDFKRAEFVSGPEIEGKPILDVTFEINPLPVDQLNLSTETFEDHQQRSYEFLETPTLVPEALSKPTSHSEEENKISVAHDLKENAATSSLEETTFCDSSQSAGTHLDHSIPNVKTSEQQQHHGIQLNETLKTPVTAETHISLDGPLFKSLPEEIEVSNTYELEKNAAMTTAETEVKSFCGNLCEPVSMHVDQAFLFTESSVGHRKHNTEVAKFPSAINSVHNNSSGTDDLPWKSHPNSKEETVKASTTYNSERNAFALNSKSKKNMESVSGVKVVNTSEDHSVSITGIQQQDELAEIPLSVSSFKLNKQPLIRSPEDLDVRSEKIAENAVKDLGSNGTCAETFSETGKTDENGLAVSSEEQSAPKILMTQLESDGGTVKILSESEGKAPSSDAQAPTQFANYMASSAEKHADLSESVVKPREEISQEMLNGGGAKLSSNSAPTPDLRKREPFRIKIPEIVHHNPIRKERVYRLLPRDIEFCVYMIETHGDDYEAMAKDERNHYLDTPKSIQRKIRVFKEGPQYSEYLATKQGKTPQDQ